MRRLADCLLDDAALRRIIGAPDAGRCPAVISGLAQIHRAHLLSAMRAALGRPIVLLVSDELEARRAAGDIEALTGVSPTELPPRDFVFRDMEGVSRSFEHRRLRALHLIGLEVAGGNLRRREDGEDEGNRDLNPPIVVAAVAAFMQRTLPRSVLLDAAASLALGEAHDLDALCARLTDAGYARAETVEGCGQFARRGGILDFFSPAHEYPIRAEFFGDEIDSLSYFDPVTQRRGENCDRAYLLPAAETVFSLGDGGSDAMLAKLETLAEAKHGARGVRLRAHYAADLERLRSGRSFPAADKYMELLYPMATALDYLPEGTIVLVSEPNRVREAAARYEKLLGDECVTLLEAGALESSLVRFCLGAEPFFSALERFPVIMADAFTASSYPLTPRSLESVLTKQLPSYGGSLETAAGDVAHYGATGFRTVIAVSNRRRADALEAYLSERGVRAALDYELERLPEPGTCVVCLGTLSAGMEYPGLKLAVLTEGQFAEHETGRARKSKAHAKTNRERVQSFTDLSPGDLVVHEQYGVGRYLGLFTLTTD
ncbi:MAG: transcription-repair coupling factor, partial [Oscillospiraceae bacterium]|nr:transcription-repair coupling factor [Oscillospiraceae bacterium]